MEAEGGEGEKREVLLRIAAIYPGRREEDEEKGGGAA